ncbi:chemotaxis protein CheW [Atrimonas thermophila]|uniref:chemotaxis protein CheW n=1 Tax=Atrimonas thermophila TaxID=3064161 RepID=UPI00399D08DB
MQAEREVHTQELQLVAFRLGKETYAVDIQQVQEIIRMQQITAVPGAPFFVEGVINLRGRIIPVIDLRKRLGLPQGEKTDEVRIVVVEIPPHKVGMVVDAVEEVLRLSMEDIEPPSTLVASVDEQYLKGVGKTGDRLVVLLDLEAILKKEKDSEKQGKE